MKLPNLPLTPNSWKRVLPSHAQRSDKYLRMYQDHKKLAQAADQSEFDTYNSRGMVRLAEESDERRTVLSYEAIKTDRHDRYPDHRSLTIRDTLTTETEWSDYSASLVQARQIEFRDYPLHGALVVTDTLEEAKLYPHVDEQFLRLVMTDEHSRTLLLDSNTGEVLGGKAEAESFEQHGGILVEAYKS